ncbi:MAG: putative damage-inducible protein DinB [Alphaproteobacteria bacterium]|jgi:uncharacterized damage-inducible protein DinB
MAEVLSAERDRFLVLFGHLADWSNKWIEMTPPDKLDWVPIEQDSVKYGDRLSRVTTKNLYIHTIVAEHFWARALGRCGDGEDMGIPSNPGLTAELEQGDLVELAGKTHKQNMELFGAYTEEQLARHVVFVDRKWTMMGFLWGVYSHRAFHLGNIDIHLRQSGVEAPDYFLFPTTSMA